MHFGSSSPGSERTATTLDTPRRPQNWSPIVISGPSGVGKGTLRQKLRERHPGLFATTVSHTTRAPRPGEKHGRDYHFVSWDEFRALVESGAFLEHMEYNGNLYGTSKATATLHHEGQVLLLDIDVEGAKSLKREAAITPRYVFIRPHDLTVLEQRLRGRNTETDEAIQQRLARARVEMAFAASTESGFDKIIVNHNLEEAVTELESFIFERS
ncbi:guanylate kinase [Sporothrix brasiliensis 5110]|uniref:guanylate kinase n=1 Tax=Sporothrix brasiliensis 5110 TaxID=1398154 RepID=A0A0C2J9H1_9PEZI|nr:guanylate kinase [Sporothrix brasiliensis 5110]KIH93597.1 guanylate kinase [Sporothrix brasiliensis 5110]